MVGEVHMLLDSGFVKSQSSVLCKESVAGYKNKAHLILSSFVDIYVERLKHLRFVAGTFQVTGNHIKGSK